MASVASAAFHVETAVVGAGVIGLAVARVLAQSGREVLILDRASLIGSGASDNMLLFYYMTVTFKRTSTNDFFT